MALINRVFPFQEESFFLFGPRGVGKSTLIREIYQNNTIWIDLLKPQQHREFLARPEYLYELVHGNPEAARVVIDEVQKVPELLSVVHDLIEGDRSIQFILTGSSSRKLKRTGANLLAGRAIHCSLHPFMAIELGDEFSLEKVLQFGTLPLVNAAARPQKVLDTYVSLYLREEIQAEGLVRNIEGFARFLEAISFSHASQLNLSSVAKECAVKRKTVENYVSILEDLLLAFRLPVFRLRAKRELSAHAKFYYFDAGVFRTLRPAGIGDSLDELNGLALEGLVAQHLRTWIAYKDEKHTLSFWRTRSGTEVDFIIHGPEEFCAIEVKNASRISSKDVKGLEAFVADYPEARALLLYRGEQQLKIGNVLCMPCEKFLRQLFHEKGIF